MQRVAVSKVQGKDHLPEEKWHENEEKCSCDCTATTLGRTVQLKSAKMSFYTQEGICILN